MVGFYSNCAFESYHRIYRPPYSHTISTFITEFANLLETVVLLNEQLLICGDFNIHVNTSNVNAIKFKDLLQSMSLIQQVTEPTHEHGNTLDLNYLGHLHTYPEIFFSANIILRIRKFTRPHAAYSNRFQPSTCIRF